MYMFPFLNFLKTLTHTSNEVWCTFLEMFFFFFLAFNISHITKKTTEVASVWHIVLSCSLY